MTLQFDDMRAFLAVVEARGFTGAAQTLGVTTSAVSQAVSRLERALGQKLLLRSTRSISLTEAGSALLPKCREMRNLEESVTALFDDTDTIGTTLTVTAPHALSQSLIMPTIGQFLAEHPKANVRLMASDEHINLIDRQVDLAIRIGEDAPQAAFRKRIGFLEEGLFAHSSYVEAKGGRPAKLGDLSDWDHIGSEWQGSRLDYALGKSDTLSVKPRLRCSTVPDTIAAVKAGLGVALLPDMAVKGAANEGANGLLRLFEISRTPIFALHHYQRQAPAKVRIFTQLLKADLSGLSAS